MSHVIRSNKNIIAGKYKLDRVLGEGGMGVVIKATHIHLDECVAVKFLQPEMLKEDGLKERFMREARLLSKIKSEHVVRVYDVDVLPSGVPYFVMEHLEGSDLSERVMRGKPLSIEEAVDFAMQACVGLAEAHACGIVHRDLKPSNLFVCERSDGRAIVKLIDFGISKDIAPASPELAATKTAELRGSPFFMAPEQLRSSRCTDTAIDIWALGVTLYHLLSASYPFEADNVMELSIKIFNDRPVPLCERRKDVPQALGDVVNRCLKKNPTERFANIAELCAALEPFTGKSAHPYAEQAARILVQKSTKKPIGSALPTSDIPSELASPEGPTDSPTLSTTSAVAKLKERPSQTSLKNTRRVPIPWLLGVVGVATTVGILAGTLTLLLTRRFQEPSADPTPGEAENVEIPSAAQHPPQMVGESQLPPIAVAPSSSASVSRPTTLSPPAQTTPRSPAVKPKTNTGAKPQNPTRSAKPATPINKDSPPYSNPFGF